MDGHEFLADQKSAFATEVLRLQKTLRELVEFLFLPPFVIQVPQLSKGIGRFVKQGGNEQGFLAVGELDLDHP